MPPSCNSLYSGSYSGLYATRFCINTQLLQGGGLLENPGVGEGVGHVIQTRPGLSRRRKQLPVGECQDLAVLHRVTDDLDALMACVQLEEGAGTSEREGTGHRNHYQHTPRHRVLSKVCPATLGYA